MNNVGEKYTITCITTVAIILIPYLVIELSEAQFHDRISMTVTETDILQLSVLSLNTSNAALYTCTAIVKLPSTEFILRNSSNFTLKLKSESFLIINSYSLPPSTNS